MTVRKATLEDKLDIAFLVKQFNKECKYPFKVNTDKVFNSLDQIINHPDFIVLVAEEDGDVGGMFIGGVTAPLFSEDIVSTELAWYMQPEYRKGRSGMEMLKQYEEWSKSKGCKFVTMIDIDPYNNLESLYTRKGYKVTEKTYVKEI